MVNKERSKKITLTQQFPHYSTKIFIRDFTFKKHELLMRQFLNCNYEPSTFSDYLLNKNKRKKILILRHDVDKRPENALKIAQIEYKLGIYSSYYFRITKESYNIHIIKKIINLGHEIGYHYEELSIAKGDYDKAIELFKENLENLRKLYQVKTICMHGSPSSKWDNRLIWQKFDYKKFDIIGEPYFDIDFNKVLYLTDTGRRWNGERVSVWDKANSKYKYKFKSTNDIICALKNSALPNEIMVNTHPQRWDNNLLIWTKELILQKIKNILKFLLNIKSKNLKI